MSKLVDLTGPSIKGSAIPGATSYALYEKKNSLYNMLAVSDAINFNLGKFNLSEGTHKLVIRARAEDYEVSDYSNEVSYNVGVVYPDYLTFSSPSSFTLEIVDKKKYWDGTLEYSTDTNIWSEWDGTSVISSSEDGKLYMRGTGNTYITGSSVTSSTAIWVLTGSNISCIGNIETLLDYQTVIQGEHPTMTTYCYGQMFYGCTSLITAPELPATTLEYRCYLRMFDGCTSLITAPELPATTLAKGCYGAMFEGCTSLITAPKLPATTLAPECYGSMFYKCTSLTTAPELPATTLAKGCYSQMFYKCTSLTTAPKLPATTLEEECYRQMFYGCTSLTTVPELPATTLRRFCYDNIFTDCTNIKLSATQTDEYQNAYRIPTSSTGTTAYSSLNNMFQNTGGTFKGTPKINTTYYTSNTVV